MHVCMNIFLYVCIYVCMHVCMYSKSSTKGQDWRALDALTPRNWIYSNSQQFSLWKSLIPPLNACLLSGGQISIRFSLLGHNSFRSALANFAVCHLRSWAQLLVALQPHLISPRVGELCIAWPWGSHKESSFHAEQHSAPTVSMSPLAIASFHFYPTPLSSSQTVPGNLHSSFSIHPTHSSCSP